MAGRDGRGPLERGVLRGRGLGPCNQERDFNNFRCGSGFDPGMGMKMGRRGRPGRAFGYYEDNMQSPKDLLQNEKEILKERLNFIDQELESL